METTDTELKNLLQILQKKQNKQIKKNKKMALKIKKLRDKLEEKPNVRNYFYFSNFNSYRS